MTSAWPLTVFLAGVPGHRSQPVMPAAIQPLVGAALLTISGGDFVGNKTIVLATFDDEATADAAAGALRDSKIAKGDAIGVLVLDDKGQVKTEKVGKRSVGKGAGIGLVLAAFTPVGAGAVVGGAALGALHHKNLGLKSGDRERIGKQLEDGKAALGVLAPVAEADAVSTKLAELGGTAEAHQTTDQALEEVQAAAPTQ